MADNSKPKAYVKFRPINGNTEDIFIKKELFFGYPEDFNDPFEFEMNFKHELLVSDTSIISNQLKNSFVVFSISDASTITNILMWSHYDNNHKGIAIVFSPDFNDKTSIFNDINKVDYCETIPSFNDISPEKAADFAEKAVRTKSKIWEYENEWRIIKYRVNGEPVKTKNSNGFDVDRGRLFSSKEGEISKIILGCKTIREDEQTVTNWFNCKISKTIQIKKAIINKNH